MSEIGTVPEHLKRERSRVESELGQLNQAIQAVSRKQKAA
jgi:hypothetical protein